MFGSLTHSGAHRAQRNVPLRLSGAEPCASLFARARSRALSSLIGIGLGLGIAAGSASSARAEQFVITDTSWTHSKDDVDSHHYVTPLPATPKNLKSPVDYSSGSVHIVLDVKTKPAGDTPTRFQVCFEGNPVYVCPEASAVYTGTGRVEWTDPVSKFYIGTNSQNQMGIDWSKGIGRVALIIKDKDYAKPQNDPRFIPTDLHAVVVLLTAGATYVPPTGGGKADAGTADAGASSTDSKDAAASVNPKDAATGTANDPIPVVVDAGRSSGGDARDAEAGVVARRDAGSTPTSNDAAPNEGGEPTSDKEDSGCRAARAGAPSNWSIGVLFVLGLTWRRRRFHRTMPA